MANTRRANGERNATRVPLAPTLARAAVVLVLLAGCESKPATQAVPVEPAPRPFVAVDPFARGVLAQIAADQKLGRDWWVRLGVVWKPEALIEVNLEKKRPGPTDFVVDADGLHFVMADDQQAYLKGALITMRRVTNGAEFDVTFPNRDAADRQRAAEWLKNESARHASPQGAK